MSRAATTMHSAAMREEPRHYPAATMHSATMHEEARR